MPVSQPVIPIKTCRFYFATDSAARLPQFPGSAWRGAFGHALKKTVCVVRDTPCGQCLLKNACAYSVVFETPPPANSEKMRKYTAAPHPFVLQFPVTASASGSAYTLDVILFGHGQRYLPYIVHALQTAGNDGIGGHRQIFRLQKIDDINQEGFGETLYQNGGLKAPQPAGYMNSKPMWSENETPAIAENVMNHSNNPETEIAVNLEHFRARCADMRLELIDSKELRRHLPTSRKRQYLRNEPIRSRLEGRTIRCWIFKR